MKIQNIFRLSLLSALLMLTGSVAVVSAQQSSSSHYQVNEVFFGTGGELKACSGNQYCSKQSAGELTVGNTKGDQYQAQAGFNTDRMPYIEVNVSKSLVDLGVVKPDTTGSNYAVFSVKSYLADGYVVQITGPAPTYDGRAIAALVTPTASSQGTEQFGINLRANTTPAVGSEPVQTPDDTFSFGTYAAGYDTANAFKYQSGDIIAQSSKSSGYTTYTISYIMNVSAVTPAGEYKALQSIVATAKF